MTSIKRSLTQSKQVVALKYRITQLENTLNSMRLADDAKNRFLANITHELRTPLNTIIGFTQILYRGENLSPEQSDYMSLILQSSEHLLGLIEDILQFSKLESGNMELNVSEFDLYELLESLDSIYYAQATEKGLTFDLQIAENTPRYLYGDKNKIRQILINLLSNAMKFTETGTITLAVKAHTDMQLNGMCKLEMRVADTGVGIAKDELQRLFEPYQQTASGEQSNTGSGLGLVITRELVKLMKGEIDVQSEWGQGTTVLVEIEAEEIEKNIEPHRNSHRVTGIAPNQELKQILIVDDKPDNRELLQSMLSNVGFDVRTVGNGLQAINQCATYSPDLIFMDMRMPQMDGYETTRRLRAMALEVKPIIIALTASSSSHEVEAITQVGCNDLIFKPFREEEIFRKLANHLNIRFTYDENDIETQEVQRVETNINLDSLPIQLQERLYSALASYSLEQVQEVIDDFPPEQEALAKCLKAKIIDFDFRSILSLFNEKEPTQ